MGDSRFKSQWGQKFTCKKKNGGFLDSIERDWKSGSNLKQNHGKALLDIWHSA